MLCDAWMHLVLRKFDWNDTHVAIALRIRRTSNRKLPEKAIPYALDFPASSKAPCAR